jgi:hypothetical protein
MAARAKNRKKLFWLSQVKQLVGFQPNLTGVISTIPSCAGSASLYKMAFRAINRKILSSLHRSSYWWDFNETSHE